MCNTIHEQMILNNDEVHIWCACFDQMVTHIERIGKTLCLEENTTANKYRFEKDRQKFLLRRGMLRMVLSRYIDIAPENIKFLYGPAGKPEISRKMNPEDIRFSVTRSKDIVVYAIGKKREIGVDVEYVSEEINYTEIMEKYFSMGERTKVISHPESKRRNAFFSVWTRKEAFLKGIGQGISFPLSRVEVSAGGSESTPSIAGTGGYTEDHTWSLMDLDLGQYYAASIAVKGNDVKLIFHDWVNVVS